MYHLTFLYYFYTDYEKSIVTNIINFLDDRLFECSRTDD